MKIAIELSDFYLDEEQDLEPALKKTIINQAVAKITADLKAKIEDGVIKEVKAQVEQTLYRKIGTFVAECIANDKIKDGGYSNSAEITLQEWVKKQFTRNAYEKAPVDDLIKKLAANFGEEMKKRYDLLFASQLVVKMKESGFIKEEAIALLLENKNS
jgi:hypothetical protein